MFKPKSLPKWAGSQTLPFYEYQGLGAHQHARDYRLECVPVWFSFPQFLSPSVSQHLNLRRNSLSHCSCLRLHSFSWVATAWKLLPFLFVWLERWLCCITSEFTFLCLLFSPSSSAFCNDCRRKQETKAKQTFQSLIRNLNLKCGPCLGL